MADEAGPAGSWLATLLVPVFFDADMTVRVISGIFIALGVAFLTPVVSLVAFDICLWLWRLYSIGRSSYMRRQRLLREELRERRRRQQQLQQQQQQFLQKQRLLQEQSAAISASSTSTTATTETSQGATRRR